MNLEVFHESLLCHELVRKLILELFEHKARTEFLLNVLLFVEFQNWPQQDLKDIIEAIAEIPEENAAKNRITLTYNPI